MCGYRLSTKFPESVLEILNTRNQDNNNKIIIEPAIFGVIIDIPSDPIKVLDSETIKRNFEELEWCLEDEESIIDIPGSGSVWYLPDEERRYFVKWLNKSCRTEIQHENNFPYRLMKRADGTHVSNISLHYENCLRKSPNFIKRMKEIANEKKAQTVHKVLECKMNIDHYSITGITKMICAF